MASNKTSRKQCNVAKQNLMTKNVHYSRGMLPKAYIESIKSLPLDFDDITYGGFKINEEGISSGLLSQLEINKKAEHGEVDDISLLNTIRSPFLGVPNYEQSICAYCGDRRYCPGHHGFMLIDKPYIPNPDFEDLLAYILTVRCIFENVGEFAIPREDVENIVRNVDDASKLYFLKSYIENGKSCCDSCKRIKIVTSKKNGLVHYSSDDSEHDPILQNEYILHILNSVSVEDAKLMGMPVFQKRDGSFGHKLTGMIMQALYIPSSLLRPFQDAEKGHQKQQKSQFSLLNNIIVANNELNPYGGKLSGDDERSKLVKDLYTAVTEWFEFIHKEISGKKGTVRMINSKDVIQSSRSVITGLTEIDNVPISMMQVGIPRSIAESDMIEHDITTENIKQWTYYLILGKVKSIRRNTKEGTPNNKDPSRITIPVDESKLPDPEDIYLVEDVFQLQIPREYILQPGDKIDAHFRNGEPLTGNRQPSLHKGSYMGHEGIIVDGESFGMNPLIVSSYNGDFDGDQMTFGFINSHEVVNGVLRMREVTREIIDRMSVANNFISTKNGNPVYGLIQDNVTSAYYMSTDTELVSWDFFYMVIDSLVFPLESKDRSFVNLDMLNHEELVDFIVQEKSIYPLHWEKVPDMEKSEFKDKMTREFIADWRERVQRAGLNERSPKAIFSLAFPSNFYYYVGDALIVDGILIRGPLTKSHVGISQNSVIKYMYGIYDKFITVGFLDNLQMITTKYIVNRGFSISIKDCDIPYSEENMKRFKYITEQGDKRTILATRDIKNKRALEKIVHGITNDMSTEATKVKNYERSYRGFSSMDVMAKHGKAKGSEPNTDTISRRPGQQFIGGSLIPRDTPGNRTSVYEYVGDITPSASGNIENPLVLGYTPEEFINHSKSARQSMGDTAIGTSKVGNLARLIKVYLEDVVVYPDGTVREQDNIIQFIYGEHGFSTQNIYSDPTEINPDHMFFIDMQYECDRLSLDKGWYVENNKYESDNGDIDQFILDVMKEDEPIISKLDKYDARIENIMDNFNDMKNYLNEEITYSLGSNEITDIIYGLMTEDYTKIIISIFNSIMRKLVKDYGIGGSKEMLEKKIKDTGLDREVYKSILSSLGAIITKDEDKELLDNTNKSLFEYLDFRVKTASYMNNVYKSMINDMSLGDILIFTDIIKEYSDVLGPTNEKDILDKVKKFDDVSIFAEELDKINVQFINENAEEFINILEKYISVFDFDFLYFKEEVLKEIYGSKITRYLNRSTEIMKSSIMSDKRIPKLFYDITLQEGTEENIQSVVERKMNHLDSLIGENGIHLRNYISKDVLDEEFTNSLAKLFTIEDKQLGGFIVTNEFDEFMEHLDEIKDKLVKYKGISMERLYNRFE